MGPPCRNKDDGALHVRNRWQYNTVISPVSFPTHFENERISGPHNRDFFLFSETQVDGDF